MRAMFRAWAPLRVVALAFVLLVLMAGPASAHTKLESSSPEAGATVDELSRIDLRFSDGFILEASHVYIRDTAGYLALAPVTHIDGDEASLTVPVPPLGDGTYEVTWHVLAEDGDPVEGTFTFTLATPVAVAPVAPPVTSADPAADAPPDTSLAITLDEKEYLAELPELGDHGHGPDDLTNAVARGVLDASLATLVGGLAFVAAVWPQGARLTRTRQVLWVAALLAAFASFELAAFQHAAATGLSTLDAFSPWHQWEALQFRFGRIAAARIALLALSAVLTARLARGAARTTRSVAWCTATTVVALGLAETIALLGHSAAPGAVAAGARLFHVLGVSIWIGGLVMLLCVVIPRRRVDELLSVMPKFSAMATGAVAILTVGGVILAVDLVGTAGALPSTGYGRMLLAKVAVVGALLYAASLSRKHVRASLNATGRLATDSVARPLALWVSTEIGLMALILGLTAVLVSRIPPG
jgi:putative copper export protein/methionine-rich copper-binding protein CopC